MAAENNCKEGINNILYQQAKKKQYASGIIKSYSNEYGWFNIDVFHQYLKDQGVRIDIGENHNSIDGHTHYRYYIDLGNMGLAFNEFHANRWDADSYIDLIIWILDTGVQF